MSWKEIYEQRLCSFDEAVGHIRSGDRVVLGSACGTPEDLIDAMLKRTHELREVELVAMVSTGKSAYARPQHAGAFRHNSFFVAPSTRNAMDEDRCDYTPCFFKEFPRIMQDGTLPCDVAMITVTPPDKVGNCSLGISVCYDYSAAKAAGKVIAEVNPNMPFTLGDSCLHVSEIDHLVWTERPIVTAPRPQIGEVENRIGRFCAELIKDGDCLQLGYGALPEAVLGFLEEKNDLGIHSEMISDGVMQLVEMGVITCARKNFKNRKIVITFAIGSREFYDWMHLNSMIEMHPVEYINDSNIIGRNDNMVSINSALVRRPAGSGGCRHDGRTPVRGDRRAGGFHPRLPPIQGRTQHPGAGGSLLGRQAQPHRADAGSGPGRDHLTPRHRLRGHRLRYRPPAGQNRQGTRSPVDRDRSPAVSRTAPGGVQADLRPGLRPLTWRSNPQEPPPETF